VSSEPPAGDPGHRFPLRRRLTAWTSTKVEQNPGYWLGGSAVFDAETRQAVLVGGDWYDQDRRYQGANTAVWTFTFEQGDQ
jgi:hypothetical protein